MLQGEFDIDERPKTVQPQLAAAQLMRIKEMGLRLTICVEQVAASGGYMMACCADEIIASPFAVIGSIGVISEQPNVYERLKREGIEFQTVPPLRAQQVSFVPAARGRALTRRRGGSGDGRQVQADAHALQEAHGRGHQKDH